MSRQAKRGKYELSVQKLKTAKYRMNTEQLCDIIKNWEEF